MPSTRRSSPALPIALAALCLALATALPARAQDAEAAGATFLDRVDVHVVNVEVFVTDRDGRRVTDLGRDDFELTVDGEPTELSNFYLASEPAGSASDGTAPLATASPQPSPVPASSAPHRPLFLTVFVDHTQIEPHDRTRVLADVRDLVLERAAQGDQVMLMEYGGSLHVVTPFSSDAETLAAGLDRLAGAAAPGATARADTLASTRAVGDLNRAAGGAGNPGTTAALHAGAAAVGTSRMQSLYDRAKRSFLALHDVVISLAGLPGRKALLWVSGGVPRRPGVELIALEAGVEEAVLQGGRWDLSRVYRGIIQEANAEEVTFYAVDARGPDPRLSLTAEHRDLLDVANLDRGAAHVEAVEFEHTRNMNLREPLLDFADATGGHAVLNTFEFAAAFEPLDRDFDTYYSLGFLSPAPGDGEYHRVKVRVKRPGLTVRHRAGFLDKSPGDRVEDRVRSFLLQGWESNPMGVVLQFGEPTKTRRRWRVPVLVRIPADAVTLLPRDGERVGQLQLFVGVRDESDRQSKISRLPQQISLPPEETAGGDLGYRLELEMRPGPASLVVGVWDEVGGGESYVFQKVIVGGAS